MSTDTAQKVPAPTLLTGAMPGELAALADQHRGRLKEIVAERGTLAAALADEEHDAALGVAAAQERVAEIREKAQRLDAETRGLQETLARITPRLDQERQAAEARAEAERRHAIVDATNRYLGAGPRIDRAVADFFSAMAQATGAQQTLRSLLGTPAKVYEVGTHYLWAVHTLRQSLVIALPRNGSVPDRAGQSSSVLHLLDGRSVNPASPLCKKTFGQVVEETILDTVLVFGSRTQAEAARDRRDPNRRGTHHVRQAPDGLFEIVEGELRGVAARRSAP